MRGKGLRAPALAVAMMALALPLQSQAPARWLPRLQLDNDAYNFWRQPGARTDEEYSNGVRFSLESQGAPWWGRRLAPRRSECADSAPTPICLSTRITLGQDIYTPHLLRAPFTTPDWETERPYFGWLYASGAGSFVSSRGLRTVELTLGVTGPPAGGELAQSIAHRFNRRYTYPATGWETQVGFEPGIIVGMRQTWLAVRAGGTHGLAFDFAPSAGIALGNVLTRGDVGGVARIGVNLSHPWDARERAERAPFEAWVQVGGRLTYVARDMSLDGTLDGEGRRVERMPGVREHELGIGARYRWLVVTYRGITRTREYATGPLHHSYAAMTAGFELGYRR